MFYRITTALLFSLLLCAGTVQAADEQGQHSMAISQSDIDQFRLISLRILSAYKHQPHYIGSTDEWHLFLRKQHANSSNSNYASVFGYKIAIDRATAANGWELSLPSREINPENCPMVSDFSESMSGFTLPEGELTRKLCLEP